MLVLSEGDVVPDVPLIDQDGKPLSLRRTGGPTIISFIYTRCADARMCRWGLSPNVRPPITVE